jgi:hypothetical protein
MRAFQSAYVGRQVVTIGKLRLGVERIRQKLMGCGRSLPPRMSLEEDKR